jgi:hypothetical protein
MTDEERDEMNFEQEEIRIKKEMLDFRMGGTMKIWCWSSMTEDEFAKSYPEYGALRKELMEVRKRLIPPRIAQQKKRQQQKKAREVLLAKREQEREDRVGSIHLKVNGETKTLAQWEDKYGVSRHALHVAIEMRLTDEEVLLWAFDNPNHRGIIESTIIKREVL